MAYMKKKVVRGKRGAMVVYQALGDYSDSSPCSSIPVGDPYRKPGNYCTQPSGNVIEFNADGSVDPDPFASGSSGGSSSSSVWGQAGQVAGSATSALLNLFGIGSKPTAPSMPRPAGMSTTTKIALAGGAVVLVALFARSRS